MKFLDIRYGMVVVRTDSYIWQNNAKIGKFCKINYMPSTYNEHCDVYYGDRSALHPSHCRKATSEELIAYHSGLLNVNDIKKALLIDSFSII